TYLPDNIVPQGWDSWGKDVNHLTYSENQRHGSGSDTSNRVKWGIKLRSEELQALTNISYIDTEGWIRQLPINVVE
ncbi:probable pectinesterase 29, partial [Olea europaea subsp. europaea]